MERHREAKVIDFIQIGANVGNNKYDIIWTLCREKKWGGILVEPIPLAFDILKKNYADVSGLFFENAAIMPYDGATTMYYSPTFENECQQASTVYNHFDLNTKSSEFPCITLEALIRKYNLLDKEFELLQIDAEGQDDTILIGTDFSRILPKYIRYERINDASLNFDGSLTKPDFRNKRVLKHLESFGYQQIPDIYNDIHPEEGEIDIMFVRTFYLHEVFDFLNEG